MSDIEFVSRDLHTLEAHLDRAAKVTGAGMYAVGKKGAQNVKEGMAAQTQGHPHFKRLGSTVGYDTLPLLLGVGFRIGFEKRGQGNLGNIYAFGTATQGRVEDITVPLKAEEPRIEAEMLKLGVEALD